MSQVNVRQLFEDKQARLELSRVAGADGADRYVWLDRCWSRLAARGEFPRVKVHGFSETRLDIMFDYPWYSVDSATWIKCGVYSQAFVPTRTNGRRILGLYFFGRGMKAPEGDYALFGRGARRIVHGTKFFSALAPALQESITKVVEDHGFTIEKLSDPDKGSDFRSAYNAVVMDRLLARHTVLPFHGNGSGLFDHGSTGKGQKNPLNTRVRFFAATTPGCDPLRYVSIHDRLLSYAFLGNGKFDLAHYVRTGGAVKRESL